MTVTARARALARSLCGTYSPMTVSVNLPSVCTSLNLLIAGGGGGFVDGGAEYGGSPGGGGGKKSVRRMAGFHRVGETR